MLEGLGYVFTDLPTGVSKKQKILRAVQVFLYKFSFPYLEKIIFLNPDDPKDLIEKYNIKTKKVEVLGAIGLNLDEYSYSKPSLEKIRFIFVGRLLAEKGIFEYIKAAKIVKKDFPNVEFVVLGGLDEQNPGGLKKEELEQLLKDNIVIYPGFVKNVDEWIKYSSVFVLPSYYREGVPRSTQEAMAVGRAVITTDVPGCRETVVDGLNGFLIPPFDANALVEAMKKFIENPYLVKKDFPNVEFVVLGGLDEQNPGGLKKEELEQLLKDNIVIYPGFVKNVDEWIKGSSVFVLPSYREGVPRSTQEAMAVGRAVITTDVPGCRETVVDGLNGFLIPPFDANALVEAMKKFIENPYLVEKMGKESYKIAKDKFDAKKVNKKLINILEI